MWMQLKTNERPWQIGDVEFVFSSEALQKSWRKKQLCTRDLKGLFVYEYNDSHTIYRFLGLSYVFAENPLGRFFDYSRLSTVAFSVLKIHSVVFSVIDGYHGCVFSRFFGYS